LSWNRNKKSVVLDIRTPSGKDTFYDMVKVSDMVINNFRPGAMAQMGADHETLKKINPGIISLNITGMGPSGPNKDIPVVDSVAAGYSGLLSVTGEPDGRPIRPGPAVCDITCALYGVIAAISALYERERTGVGQNIDVPLLGASIALMGYHISYYTCSGEIPKPLGSGYPFTAPFGAYKTKDSWIVLGPCWPRIAYAIGADWLVDDPRFAKTEDRLKNRLELDKEIEQRFLQAKTEEWLVILRMEDIISGPLNTVDQTVNDPQVNHLNMILNIEHPLGGAVRLAGNPIIMPGLNGEHLPPPTLGQHTDEVLAGVLGYSEERIRKIKGNV
jgi:crotonobetainyl-CoA:carnitine CoA-transferase CaiB-like acyl-CoA transferase